MALNKPKEMRELLSSIVKGLKQSGYNDIGGNDLYRLLVKEKQTIKVFIKPEYQYIVVGIKGV